MLGIQESEETKKKREAEMKLRNTAWQDLDIEQKLERMREEVKQNNSNLNGQFTETRKSIEELKKHSHQGEKIVIPMETFSNAGICGQLAEHFPEGKEYF